MANKEICRTIWKLWMLNYCIIIVIITLHLSYTLGIETKEESLQNVTSVENDTTSQSPIAEPLVRYRRQPPRTVIKHIIRPKRFKMKRVKRPKIKYSFAEPPPTFYSRKPLIIKKPTFDSSIFEDFSHMNVESADFDLPPSSYEAQSMDLDLYKHYEPGIEAASYKEIHKPSLYTYAEPEISYKETSYTEVSKSPSYTYSVPDASFKESNKPSATYSYAGTKRRRPHTNYGVPTEFVYSTGYDKPNDNKYTFEAPHSKQVYTEIEKPHYNVDTKNTYTYHKPSKEVLRIPATTYGVPNVQLPTTGSNDYDKYSVVEQKPPYEGHTPGQTKSYHFAEPPHQPEPSIEITYSPSYEINIPPRKENSYAHGENHEPAQHLTPQHLPASFEEPNYQEHPKYEEPPTGNYYENSQQETYEEIEPSHQEVAGTNQPASYQPAPAKQQNIDDYFPPSQNLPINANHKHPSYDYPKSSYEVPIYDPVPFDASNNQEREIYPPQSFEDSNKHHSTTEQRPPVEESTANDIHSTDNGSQVDSTRPQSSTNHMRRTRKRKRNKGSSTTVSTTKHILDVRELQEAFERENRNKYANSPEPDAHESQRFENVNHHNNINNNYSKGPWNPMKIRTSPITLKTTSTTIPAISSLFTKSRRYPFKQLRTTINSTTSTTTTEAPIKVEIISIEKSRSKSYYDGATSAPRTYNPNLFRNRFRLENTRTSTTTPPHVLSANENSFSKRTTKNIFDTTIFKSPINEADVYRNLPKNHKLN